jgi:hypothetical protein
VLTGDIRRAQCVNQSTSDPHLKPSGARSRSLGDQSSSTRFAMMQHVIRRFSVACTPLHSGKCTSPSAGQTSRTPDVRLFTICFAPRFQWAGAPRGRGPGPTSALQFSFLHLRVTSDLSNTELTNPMQQNPSSEANSCSVSQTPSLFRGPKVHYRVHNSSPLVPIVSQMNPAHTLLFCFFNSHFAIVLPSMSKSS